MEREKDGNGASCSSCERQRHEAKARGSYTSISEYWNNSNAGYPDVYTSRRVLYTPRYSDDCQEQDILRDARRPSFFPLLKQPQRRQDALRKVEATARNSSPFVGGIKPARNRCLQFRSAPRFRAIPVFFSSLLFFSFSLLFFFFLRAKGAISIVEHELQGLDGGKNAEKEQGEGTRSFRS